MNRHKLRELIDALLEGEISEADFLTLEAEMSVDEELRKEYLNRVTLSTLLEAEAEQQESAAGPFRPTGVTSFGDTNSWTRSIAGSLVAFLLVGLAFALWPRGTEVAKDVAEPVEEKVVGYGVISGQDRAVWSNSKKRATGSLLPTGDLKLESGVVQLELFSGVSIVVEGPAEFAVTSPMHMSVQSGKLRAHVPEPAHGFRVSTRDGDVVDLGTDFAVDVTQQRSELHVLEGEVELQSRNQKARRLAQGQALNMAAGSRTEIPADRNRFVGQNEMVDRLQVAMKSRRERWLAWNQQIRNVPSLVALYQPGFREKAKSNTNEWQADRRIPNLAASSSQASEGAVVAAVRTTDRWQQRDGAIDFSPTGSRVRVTIPGEFGSLTLNCWIKINSLDRWYNSLFLTDGHDRHEPHWQIMDDGRLFFSVKKRDVWDSSKGEKDKHIYFSPPFWDSSLSGQWLMISTVYDVENRMVLHYLNGDQLSEEQIPADYLVQQVKIGNASLCNWSEPERDEPRFAVRNLNGSLDEFAMFSEALTPEQIHEMYESGRP